MISKVFNSQCKNPTTRDWVSTIKADLEYLGLNVNFADIRAMSKGKWKNTVKRSIKENSFINLEKIKQGHSKVNKLKHFGVEMQSYFKPNGHEARKEEIQTIFKMRCNMTKVKINMKGMYDTFECGVCLKDDETQEHIYTCKEIWKMREENSEIIPEYNKIFNGNTREKLNVARIYKKNLEILEKIS